MILFGILKSISDANHNLFDTKTSPCVCLVDGMTVPNAGEEVLGTFFIQNLRMILFGILKSVLDTNQILFFALNEKTLRMSAGLHDVDGPKCWRRVFKDFFESLTFTYDPFWDSSVYI